jgi:hypothetical protein
MHNFEFYSDISTVPIYNWWYYGQRGDASLLLKVPSKDPVPDYLAKDVYYKLQDQLNDLYGAPTSSKVLFALLKRRTILNAEYIETGQKHLKNLIEIASIDINFHMPKDEDNKQTLESILAPLSKFMGYRIDPKICTVTEFKENINYLEKWQKNQSKAAK